MSLQRLSLQRLRRNSLKLLRLLELLNLLRLLDLLRLHSLKLLRSLTTRLESLCRMRLLRQLRLRRLVASQPFLKVEVAAFFHSIQPRSPSLLSHII
jgi:hypothetical protein